VTEREKEDVSSYWMTWRKRRDTEVERGCTRSPSLDNSIWKRLWSCRKTYMMMSKGNEWILCIIKRNDKQLRSSNDYVTPCEVFITVTSSWMSPLTLAELYNFSKELTASMIRTEADEVCRFHRNIGRFLSHFTTSSLIRHYVTSNTYNSSVGRAIALVVRLWLPTRVFRSVSVTHARFAADHSSLEHVSLPIIITPLPSTHPPLWQSWPGGTLSHFSVGSLVSSRHFPGHVVRTLFHQRVCDVIKRGASEAKHFPRAFSWLLSASEWWTHVSSVNCSCHRDSCWTGAGNLTYLLLCVMAPCLVHLIAVQHRHNSPILLGGLRLR